MKDLYQTSLDYCLGILPGHESAEFEALVADDPKIKEILTGAMDDLGLIGQSTPDTNLAPIFANESLISPEAAKILINFPWRYPRHPFLKLTTDIPVVERV